MSRQARHIALIVGGAFFMVLLDSAIIATSLPRMAQTFGVKPVELSIGISIYLLSVAAFVPLSGWLSDRYGARRIFLISIIVFVAASLACGAADSLEGFALARAAQGLGGALMTPIGRVIVLNHAPKNELVRAMAYITWPALTAPVIGPVDVDPGVEGLAGGEPGAGGPVRSPGMKYRHYAPRTPCVLYEGPPEAVAEAVAVRLREERARGRRVGLLATAESAGRWEADAVRIAGARSAPETIARSLYRCLRELDEAGVDLIIMEGIEPAGLGAAIMNRMRRAAGHRTVAVGPREPA